MLPTPETETERDRQFKAMHPMGADALAGVRHDDGRGDVHAPVPQPVPGAELPRTGSTSRPTGRTSTTSTQRQLQHLQWRNHRDRWVLKTGAHMWGLEHLLRTYPDARIVFTHRDPVKSVTSYASLTSLVRSTGSDDVDRFEIAQDWTARLKRVIDHAMAVRAGGSYPDAIFYDMHFPDFVADQFAVISDIYDALDLPMTDEGAARMKAFIADNPKGKHGVHLYTPEEYGIDPEVVRRDLKAYIEQLDLAPE